MPKKEEVVKQEAMPVEQIPEYLRTGTGKGNENVTMKDMTVPRLQIVQDLSPELDADNAEKFIPAISKGDVFNSLTREFFKAVQVVNIFYRMEYNIFVTRKRGGGFRGTYQDLEAANRAVKQSDHPEDLEIIDTGVHFVLILDEHGTPIGEAAIPMKATQLKVSRNWNSLIRMRGENLDRFASTWKLTTIKQKNDKGNFYNFNVISGGWVTPPVFAAAQRFYDAIVSGAKDLDRTDLNAPDVKEEDF
jgi:hypothetical protein